MKNQLNHVAIIMDGNGRWAKKQKQIRTFGHFHGAQNVRDVALAAQAYGVNVLTLYAFSTENWKRPLKEVEYLMKLPAYFFDKFMQELMEKQIKIEFIGHFDRLPKGTAQVLQRAIEMSKNNTSMRLCFAMDYGSRDELVNAFKAYAADVALGRDNDLTEEGVNQYLMTHHLGDVDLMIRTSLEYRLSNFLLWQSAYAELMFVDVAWPDFTPEKLKECLDDYQTRNRRFGGVEE